MTAARRHFLKTAATALTASAIHPLGFAQTPSPAAVPAPRRFEPAPGAWRTYEVTTRVEVLYPKGATQIWLPVPSVDTPWQQSLESSYSTPGEARMTHDTRNGAKMLHVRLQQDERTPVVELTSRVRTQSRAVDWAQKSAEPEDASTLRYWTRPTALLPTDGIVRSTALQAVGDARTDVDKARRIYEWIIANTYREPKVRGCGEGDIKAMLETGNLGGKCADLNALFVGMARSVGIPARDIYGLRLVPSAFGYKELSGNPASLKGAQHCRAEVHLKGHGWVAMDPADVAKVMRQETAEWIKTPKHPVVTPVYERLFGGWEGNWVAWNTAHDIALPGTRGPALGFFMYPTAENDAGRFDPYAPDDFKYTISAREIV